MVTNDIFTAANTPRSNDDFGLTRQQMERRTVHEAVTLYEETRRRSMITRIWAGIRRRDAHLLDLSEVHRHTPSRAGREIQAQNVPLCLVRGSENRSRDFDMDFRPIRDYTKTRWVGIACAMLLGSSLPPVELIQAGDIYYVRDGHHRISVAKALGQEYIDAKVTVWSTAVASEASQPVSAQLAGQPC